MQGCDIEPSAENYVVHYITLNEWHVALQPQFVYQVKENASKYEENVQIIKKKTPKTQL